MAQSCAILIPSLNRSAYIADVAKNVHEATPEEHRIYWCIGDEASRHVLDELGEEYLWDGEVADKRYVTRMNKLCRYVEETDIFFGSDDVVHEHGWLTAARAVQQQGYPVVVVNDLRNPSGTQALMLTSNLPTACFDDPEAAFHHGYKHNFADTEQFITARMQGKLGRAMDSIVEHLHPRSHDAYFERKHPSNRPLDATYTDAQGHWDHDARLFNQRMRQLQVKYG